MYIVREASKKPAKLKIGTSNLEACHNKKLCFNFLVCSWSLFSADNTHLSLNTQPQIQFGSRFTQYIRSKLGEYHRKKYYLQSQNNLKYQFPVTQYYLFSVYTTITNFCQNKYDNNFFRTCQNFLLDIIKSSDSGKYISHYVLITLRPSGTLLFSGLPMLIWQKKFQRVLSLSRYFFYPEFSVKS